MKSKLNQVAIDGATGILGYALVSKFVELGKFVHIIARESSDLRIYSGLEKYIEIHKVDLKNYNFYEPDFQVEAFYHLAWEGTNKVDRNSLEIQYNNIGYSISAVNLAQRLGSTEFIGIGSQAEYYDSDKPYGDHTKIDPSSYYGIAKFSAGKFTKLLCDELNIKHIWIRVFSLFGLYDSEDSFFSKLLYAAKNKIELRMSHGNQVWDYLYSHDAADIIFQLSLKGKHGCTYSLGSGNGKTINEYIRIIQKVLNTSVKVIRNHDEIVSRKFLVAEISEIEEVLGRPINIDFETAFRKFLREYQSYNL